MTEDVRRRNLPGLPAVPTGALTLNQSELVRVVKASPGLCIQDITDRLGWTRTATVHHVRRLGDMGLVRSVRHGRRLVVVPRETDQREARLMAMLRLSAVRRIVQEVEREPDVSRRVLARRVGLTESSARWHLRRLKAAGALEVVPDVQSGREVFRVGEQVRDLLAARGRHVEPRTNPLGRA